MRIGLLHVQLQNPVPKTIFDEDLLAHHRFLKH
jgi:hypothetical protein